MNETCMCSCAHGLLDVFLPAEHEDDDNNNSIKHRVQYYCLKRGASDSKTKMKAWISGRIKMMDYNLGVILRNAVVSKTLRKNLEGGIESLEWRMDPMVAMSFFLT